MIRLERQLARLRSLNPFVIDAIVAAAFTLICVVSVFVQNIHDSAGSLRGGYREPNVLTVLTVLAACAPIAIRRRWPVLALAAGAVGILVHFLAGWPEGFLPIATLLLTYTVGELCPLRKAVAGLSIVATTVVILMITDSPQLDTAGALGVLAQFAAVWAIGVAVGSRREAADASVLRAEERADAARQGTARILAEERLLIAQELHDVVAHSMSVIAVQAGVGAHVVDERPEQARVVLETISATSRGTLTEMRRLLGVLRDADGVRSHLPAPGLADVPQLVADVQGAGVPATIDVEGEMNSVPLGLGVSAYRVIQEALTNVIKHAGEPTRVSVTVRHVPGSLTIEVVDDGHALAAVKAHGAADECSGHGLVGMRERVQVWGGELVAGPSLGGGYRVAATLPYGDAE
ncbi:MAG: histidine kinase [Ilumatobacteraceae bacterium]